MSYKLFTNIEEKLRRLDELEKSLGDPGIVKKKEEFLKLTKETSELRKLKTLYKDYRGIEKELEEAEHVLKESPHDRDLMDMAKGEVAKLSRRQLELMKELESLLVRKDPRLSRNAVIEIRAGTGGLEASLFAADIFRMYSRYAASKGYKVEILTQALTEAGGIREIVFLISGEGVFGRFRHESGVHRVQRVPVTEASGRIHTSAVTVAVLPEAEEVEVKIKPEELRVDVFRSGGPGGQSVNTTDSAVRLTHLPTNIMVKCQDEKSQLKNKQKAMKILLAKLYDLREKEAREKMATTRRRQVGGGDRSEKIRTYNFPEKRVTDHRIGLTLHRLDEILNGDLDGIIDSLMEKE